MNFRKLDSLFPPADGYVAMKMDDGKYGVFHACDVQFVRAPVRQDQAGPIVSGLDRLGAAVARTQLSRGKSVEDVRQMLKSMEAS